MEKVHCSTSSSEFLQHQRNIYAKQNHTFKKYQLHEKFTNIRNKNFLQSWYFLNVWFWFAYIFLWCWRNSYFGYLWIFPSFGEIIAYLWEKKIILKISFVRNVYVLIIRHEFCLFCMRKVHFLQLVSNFADFRWSSIFLNASYS